MLVYLESSGVLQVANNIYISEKSSSVQGGITIGVPLLNFELHEELTSSLNISTLMPETLAKSIYKSLEVQTVRNLINLLKSADDKNDGLSPGSTVLVSGILKFPEIGDFKNFNPLEPPELSLKQYRLHGEAVIVASLFEDPFYIPVYFSNEGRNHVPYANGQEVALLGVCKWVPPYRPGSGSPLELALRVYAVWIN